MKKKGIPEVAGGRARRLPGASAARQGRAAEDQDHAGPYLSAARPQPALQPEQHAGDGGDRSRHNRHRRGRLQGHAGAMRRLAIGKDPFRIEAIWQEEYMAWFYPPGREKQDAMGALDLALWDIKGKAVGLPSTRCWAARCGTTARPTTRAMFAAGRAGGAQPTLKDRVQGYPGRGL